VALTGRPALVCVAHRLAHSLCGLDPDDARQAGQDLVQAQIPFEPTADGAGIRVPAAQLDKARLATAAKGGLKSGRMGFEIFDKPNWVGSEFDEQVNYQRALEGELEHTVGTLSDVASARVHLVMPHDSLFRDQERPAKASVVIKLRHRALADGEPEAIRNLVASAVDGLTPDRVVLVDADGHLPLGPKTAEAMQLSAEQASGRKAGRHARAGDRRGQRARLGHAGLRSGGHRGDPGELRSGPDGNPLDAAHRAVREPAGGRRSSRHGLECAQFPGAAGLSAADHGAADLPRPSREPTGLRRRCGTWSRIREGAAADGGHRGERPAAPARQQGQGRVWQPRSAEELRNLTALAQAAVGFDTVARRCADGRGSGFRRKPLAAAGLFAGATAGTAENSPVLVKYAALLVGLLVVVAFGVRPALRGARVRRCPGRQGAGQGRLQSGRPGRVAAAGVALAGAGRGRSGAAARRRRSSSR
jgi:flagellar M-ring protein FliF